MGKSKRNSIYKFTLIFICAIAILTLYVAYKYEYSCNAICLINKTLGRENITITSANLSYNAIVYIANNSFEQERGYMFADTLGENCTISAASFKGCEPKGMLFVFQNQSNECFWMDNTQIPLEQIWIDSNGSVTEVYNATPFSRANICYIGRYVLETNATYMPIKIGDIITPSAN